MLEILVDFVTTMHYADYTVKNVLDADQQLVMQTECLRTMHDFIMSLYTWAFEDPREYAKRQDRQVIEAMSKNVVSGSSGVPWDSVHPKMSNTELYLDSWASEDSDADDDETRRGEDSATHRRAPSMDSVVVHSDVASSVASDDAGCSWGSNPVYLSLGRRRNIQYHWKHIHHMLVNKRILLEAASLFRDHWKVSMDFLTQRKVMREDDTQVFAKFLRRDGIDKRVLCAIFERVVKDPMCKELFEKYLATFNYRSVPIDVALRDTTCEFMSWERPQFESQVWGTIQELFGHEYAKQNQGHPVYGLSSRDADVLSGVLLFLHTSLHNANAKGVRMSKQQFLRDGADCLESPPPENIFSEMYDRVKAKRWGLDHFRRTPRQQELAERNQTPCCCIWDNDAAVLLPTSSSAKSDEDSGVDAKGVVAAGAAVSKATYDAALMAPATIKYTEDLDQVKTSGPWQHLFVRFASQQLLRLEAEHRLIAVDEKFVLQPYITAHYAQHVRPMFIDFFPHVYASCYASLRLFTQEPALRLVLDTFQRSYDIAAALLVSIGGLEEVGDRVIRERSSADGALRLGLDIRAAITAFFMNKL
jgi:hypothetical protein